MLPRWLCPAPQRDAICRNHPGTRREADHLVGNAYVVVGDGRRCAFAASSAFSLRTAANAWAGVIVGARPASVNLAMRLTVSAVFEILGQSPSSGVTPGQAGFFRPGLTVILRHLPG